MSLGGLPNFLKALDSVMSSKTFKEASEGERMYMGYELVRYGAPSRQLVMEEKGTPSKRPWCPEI